MEALRRQVRQVDFVLIGVVIALSIFSCVAILAASHGKPIDVLKTTHIVEKQMVWAIVGFVAMLVVAGYDYRGLRKWHWWLYGLCIVLLVAVYGFARINGAHSWIHFAGMTMEPSEFAKVALVISVAAYMASVDEQEEPRYGIRNVFPVLGLFIVPWALTYKEPALGQSLVMFASVLTMYIVFAKRTHFAILSLLFFAIVGGLSYMVSQEPKLFTHWIHLLVKHHIVRSFQVDRVITWINPNYDLSGTGFAVNHAQIAVGSGGLFGEGLFQGILTSNPYGVPNQTTDYIFTAIGEEFGFVACTLLILLFLLLVHRIIRASAVSQDSFGTYILVGIAAMYGFQVFENIGMNVYLSPATGITLPFISYGGTSVVANYMAVGLALSVAMRRKPLRFTR